MTDEIQLDAAELHDLARDKQAPAPAQFRQANDYVERTRARYEVALAERDDLIRAARRVGIPYAALKRWTGLSLRRLDQIHHDR